MPGEFTSKISCMVTSNPRFPLIHRINTQLEMLTNSLIAWRQLESGLSEFHLALGQDRGTLKGLEGALDKGQATPVELAQNVKLVAKLLSPAPN